MAPVLQPQGGRKPSRLDADGLPERSHQPRTRHQQGRQPARAPHRGSDRLGLATTPARQRVESLVHRQVRLGQLGSEEDGHRGSRPSPPDRTVALPGDRRDPRGCNAEGLTDKDQTTNDRRGGPTNGPGVPTRDPLLRWGSLLHLASADASRRTQHRVTGQHDDSAGTNRRSSEASRRSPTPHSRSHRSSSTERMSTLTSIRTKPVCPTYAALTGAAS